MVKREKGVSLITLIITIIVVIILAVIVLSSGASDAPDQAAFSKFTTEMGELQDAVTKAMLEAKADELIEGNQRSEAQLYNFIARGGYEGFEWERNVYGNTVPDEDKWLIQVEAEQFSCTPINKLKAKESIGMKLPVIKVETAKGVGQELSYFVTKGGIVFCWPPYVYDGKSYVNANTTVKKDTFVDDDGRAIISGDEMKETEATDNMIKNGERIIAFSDENEYVKVKNGDGANEEYFTPYRIGVGEIDISDFAVLYYDSYPRVTQDPNNSGALEKEEEKEARGEAKGYDFKTYSNSELDW